MWWPYVPGISSSRGLVERTLDASCPPKAQECPVRELWTMSQPSWTFMGPLEPLQDFSSLSRLAEKVLDSPSAPSSLRELGKRAMDYFLALSSFSLSTLKLKRASDSFQNLSTLGSLQALSSVWRLGKQALDSFQVLSSIGECSKGAWYSLQSLSRWRLLGRRPLAFVENLASLIKRVQ